MTKINKISVSVRIIRPAFVILWGIFIINLISENLLNENYYADVRFVNLLSTQTSGPVCTICHCQQQKFVRIQWKKFQTGKIKGVWVSSRSFCVNIQRFYDRFPGHFVPRSFGTIFVISYHLLFSFRSFCTQFGHFVRRF